MIDKISSKQESLLKLLDDKKRRIKNSGIGLLIGTICEDQKLCFIKYECNWALKLGSETWSVIFFSTKYICL